MSAEEVPPLATGTTTTFPRHRRRHRSSIENSFSSSSSSYSSSFGDTSDSDWSSDVHQQQQQRRDVGANDVRGEVRIDDAPCPPTHATAGGGPPAPSTAAAAGGGGTAGAGGGVEGERQLLLLMLLAQVCSLHDATPRTFAVHVLSLFERGILDRSSIRFLFDLGLVPGGGGGASPSADGGGDREGREKEALVPYGGGRVRAAERLLLEAAARGDVDGDDTVPHAERRQREASAIRSRLERRDSEDRDDDYDGDSVMSSPPVPPSGPSAPPTSTPQTSSWAVERHPLSLSRYQREFDQTGLLASGAFGDVYRATNKLDGRDYAVKRVAFTSTGFSNDGVQLVVREVRCLARLDHPNCVRYYTSWLEPSWMTGSGGSAMRSTSAPAIGGVPEERRMLADVAHVAVDVCDGDTVGIESELGATAARLSAWSLGTNGDTEENWDQLKSHHTDASIDSISTGGYGYGNDDRSEYSEWSNYAGNDAYRGSLAGPRPLEMEQTRTSVHKSFEAEQRRINRGVDAHEASSSGAFRPCRHRQHQGRKRDERKPSYTYQICLFIQMQLCQPTTLADWIRARNANSDASDHHLRARPAFDIFRQIVMGLAHVHSKGIIHRDLKPANIFTADDGVFKIGDFGLSKMLRSANRGRDFDCERRGYCAPGDPLSPSAGGMVGQSLLRITTDSAEDECDGWSDPHTAAVGTASYAAPEQIETESYGPKADIFSLGLILLELFSNFGSEHERAAVFRDCRRGELPPWMRRTYPEVADLVLACTKADLMKRPTARDIQVADVFQESEGEIYRAEMNGLRGELRRKEEEIKNQNALIQEKDRVIRDLRLRLDKLTHSEGNKENGCPTNPH